MIINIAEAKTHFSQIIERVHHGEKITIAKNNFPLVDLVPHQQLPERQLGIAKGLLHYGDDIFATDDAEQELFYQSRLEP